MTPLGRGLASLIPRRHSRKAEDIIEQIDSMDETLEEPANVKELRRVARNAAVETVDEAEDVPPDQDEEKKTVTVVDDDEESAEEEVPPVAKATVKAVSIVEEFEELETDDVQLEPPSAPRVTPLTIDPETGMIVERVAAAASSESTDGKEEGDAEPEEEASTDDADEDLFAEEESDLVFELDDDDEEEPTKAAPAVAKATTSKLHTKTTKITTTTKVTAPAAAEKPVIKATATPTPTAPVPAPAEVSAEKVTAEEFRLQDKTNLLGEKVQQILLGDIEVNPLQPRRQFNETELDELANSLDQHGMLQPIVVMEKDDGQGFQIIAGERRFRAAKRLGWSKVPCVIRQNVSGDRNRLELALTENVQRQNLNPVEEALGYHRLNEEYGMSHEEIGERVGKSRVGVTNVLRLLQLPAEIQRGLIEEKITVGHAKAILMIPDEDKQLRFYKHVLDEGLTVRKAENRARRIQRNMKLNDPLRKKLRGRPGLALKYDGVLEERYGYNARVKFDQNKNRFEVTFQAFSEAEAEELIQRLLGEQEAPAHPDDDLVESERQETSEE